MNKFLKISIALALIAFLAAGFLLVSGFAITGKVIEISPTGMAIAESPGNVACTADAKLCPDGSYVSRQAPLCEFATCPGCQILWWFDNTHRTCSQKEFCGTYMYQGLQTFASQSECNAALNLCTDSDNGKNYYVAGIVKSGSESKTDSCTYCTGACPVPTGGNVVPCEVICRAVVEYYCGSNGAIGEETYACPNGCKDGACIKEEPLTTCDATCKKTGYASGRCKPELTSATGSKSFCGASEADVGLDGCPQIAVALTTDSSTGGQTSPNYPLYHCCCVKTEECHVSGSSCCKGDVCSVTSVMCLEGYAAKFYGCNEDCTPIWKCEGALCGNNICEAGEASECPECYYSEPPCLSPCKLGTCPQDCDGVKCTDSDGGKNYYVKGYSSGNLYGGERKKVSDTCFNYGPEYGAAITSCETKGTGGGICAVQEYYCYDDKTLTSETYNCPNGCKDGACVQQPSTSNCTDSDGGKNYYVKGFVYSTVGPQAPESGWDDCLDDYLQSNTVVDVNGNVIRPSTGTKLSETFCNSQQMYESVIVDCANGCADGACVKEYASCDVTCQKNSYAYGKCKPELTSATGSKSFCGVSEADVGLDGCPQIAVALTTDSSTGGQTSPNYPLYHCCCVKKENACYSNADCETGFCEFVAGKCSGPGTCVKKPSVCVDLYKPVCGCDKKTYSNDCVRQVGGVSKLYDRECGAECPKEEPILCKEGMFMTSYIGDDGCTHWKCSYEQTACEKKGGYCSFSDLGCKQGYFVSEALGCPSIIGPSVSASSGGGGGGQVVSTTSTGEVVAAQVTSTQTTATQTQATSIEAPTPTATTANTPVSQGRRAVCCLPKTTVPITPVCDKIGTDKEGWYLGDKLVKYEKCSCFAQCKNIGSQSEGYYNSCSGELIMYVMCSKLNSLTEPVEVTIKNKPVVIEQKSGPGGNFVEISSADGTATTNEKLRVEEGKIGMVTPQGTVDIKYLPDEIKQTIQKIYGQKLREIKEIKLVDINGRPTYEVSSKVRSYILWIIPYSKSTTTNVDAGTNRIIT